MKSGPQQPKRNLHIYKLILAIAVVALVVLAIWIIFIKDKKNESANSLGDFQEYTSSEYGFRFSYPNEWGSPKVTKVKGKTGYHYSVTFGNNGKSKINVTISLDSNGYTREICTSSSNCQTINTAVTSQSINNQLKNSDSYIKHDSNSYAFISTSLGAGTSSLYDNQIISISKINVSAAAATYLLKGSNNCPAKSFALDNKNGCLKQSDYNKVNQVMKSLKEL
jgi:hypothetical protein